MSTPRVVYLVARYTTGIEKLTFLSGLADPSQWRTETYFALWIADLDVAKFLAKKYKGHVRVSKKDAQPSTILPRGREVR